VVAILVALVALVLGMITAVIISAAVRRR